MPPIHVNLVIPRRESTPPPQPLAKRIITTMNKPIEPTGGPAPSPQPLHDITRIVLMVLVIAMMIAGSFWVLRPFLPALVWATMIVVATWPLMKHAERLLWHRRPLAVAVMTIAFLVLVIAP